MMTAYGLFLPNVKDNVLQNIIVPSLLTYIISAFLKHACVADRLKCYFRNSVLGCKLFK